MPSRSLVALSRALCAPLQTSRGRSSAAHSLQQAGSAPVGGRAKGRAGGSAATVSLALPSEEASTTPVTDPEQGEINTTIPGRATGLVSCAIVPPSRRWPPKIRGNRSAAEGGSSSRSSAGFGQHSLIWRQLAIARTGAGAAERAGPDRARLCTWSRRPDLVTRRVKPAPIPRYRGWSAVG